LPH
jgi:hypothetical protein